MEARPSYAALEIDDESFAESLWACLPALTAAARFMSDNRGDAEELVSWTLEMGFKRRKQLRSLEAIRPWLLAMEARQASRVRRRFSRLVGVRESRVVDLSPSVDDADRIAVRDAVRRLPRRTRAAVVMHFMVGLTVRETAAALGVSENTVKTQLKTGLAQLRRDLAP